MAERRWALLIGACDYDMHPSLQYATGDAVDFADALVGNLGFDSTRTLILADSPQKADFRPTRRDVFHALGLLRDPKSAFYTEGGVDPIAEEDLLVFYFSGHGVQTQGGRELLLPIDASNYSIEETAVPLDTVVGELEKLPCRHKVLFVDACREELHQGAKAVAGAKGIGQSSVVNRPGLATFYSCDPEQRSYELDDLAHGSFTFCLLEAVKHPKVNTLGELDGYLKSRVPTENTKRKKPTQQPFSVPNPADMLNLPLFLLKVSTDLEDLLGMANELAEKQKLTYEWWDKITSLWEAGAGENFELKRQIFTRFYEEGMSFEEFETQWLRSERSRPGPSSYAARLSPLPQRSPPSGDRKDRDEAEASDEAEPSG